jgi:hypothetical protein
MNCRLMFPERIGREAGARGRGWGWGIFGPTIRCAPREATLSRAGGAGAVACKTIAANGMLKAPPGRIEPNGAP